MEYNSEQRVQISRSKYIEDSRPIAVLRLNEKDFLKGEVCMLNYYKDPDFRTDIGVIVAIGIKDGVGEECYRILSVGGTVPVREVVSELPDVSKLVHGELYVYEDPETKVWNYVYKSESGPERIIEPITGGPYIFESLEDGFSWFYEDQDCKREDDFFATSKLEEIVQAVVNLENLKLNLSSQNGYVFKTGLVKDIILEISAENNGEDVTDLCSFYVGDKEITLDEEGKYIYSSVNRDTTITIEARYKISNNIWIPFQAQVDVKFGYYFYYGNVLEDWRISEDNIKSLKPYLSYKRNITYDDIILKQEKIVFAYPKTYGYLAHIFDIHGLDYIHTYQAYDLDVNIDNEPYLVYIKKDVVSINDFKQTYVFNDSSDSIVEEDSNLSDIITAWKNRNSFGGLVSIGEDGKISEDLYNLDAASTFPKLVAVVEEYPSEGLTVGDIYYNETEKMIFTAVSETEGVISYPRENTMYIYDNKFYSWTGNSLQPFGRIGTRKLNNVEELYGRN
jgi:hypothetical protein